MNLSKECLQLLEDFSNKLGVDDNPCMSGAIHAIRNQKILEAANLISLIDAIEFAKWLAKEEVYWTIIGTYSYKGKIINEVELYKLFIKSKTK
jgi:hypothetical protein